jgi:hypothetical protein
MAIRLKIEPRSNRTKVRNPSPSLVLALIVADQIRGELGYDYTIITSINDGQHSHGSRHYSGDAGDIRTWDMQPDHRDRFESRLKDRLGPDYDVVIESTERNGNTRWAEHAHIEHHPKYD